ncbi:hypothetical protein MHYP_G00365610 [Metynnis hypsauchen]
MMASQHRSCKRDQHMKSSSSGIGHRISTEELHVEAPEEVTEGETADLTCKTTCSLTDPTFIWYKDGRPLTTKTIKNNQLHLQTVSSEDAGSYSCANTGLRVKPPDDDSCSVNVYENVTKAGLRAPPPDDDSSSAQDYENLTGSGLNAPPPDDDSSSTDDYENITDDYENVTVLIYTINIQFLRAEKQRPPPVSSHTADKEASDGQTSQTLKGAVKTLITPLNV